MEAQLERDLVELLEIATRLADENRAPTEEEKDRFRHVQEHLQQASPAWRERLADQINHFAAALEGMGL